MPTPSAWLRSLICGVCAGALGLGGTSPRGTAATRTITKDGLDVAGFDDSRHHWRNIIQPERFMQATGPDQPAYAPEQVREIAANIVLFQRDNGGWPKDYDMRAVLTEERILSKEEIDQLLDI